MCNLHLSSQSLVLHWWNVEDCGRRIIRNFEFEFNNSFKQQDDILQLSLILADGNQLHAQEELYPTRYSGRAEGVVILPRENLSYL